MTKGSVDVVIALFAVGIVVAEFAALTAATVYIAVIVMFIRLHHRQ